MHTSSQHASQTLQPVKQKVRVYNSGLLSELLHEAERAKQQHAKADGQEASASRPTTRPSTQAQDFSQSDSLQKRIDRIKLLKYQELNRVGELTRKQLNRTMQRLSKQRETSFQDSFDQLQHGLTSQDGIISQVNDILQQSASVKHQKKVFQKIQKRLSHGLSKNSPQQLEQRLAKQYEQYLHTVNTTAGVFRDTIAAQVYDPLAPRQHTLRIPTGDIQDPVKRDLEKSQREREQLMPTRLRSPPVAGKETLNTVLWDKLESTPHGHHMDRDGNYVTKALTPEELLLRRSDVVFDDYNVATGRDVMMAENMQNGMVRLKEGGEGRGLFPVLQPQGNPYVESHPTGDVWLQSMWKEGKAKAAGPEVKRGRSDLAEVLWQSSNPYKDGRSLGDQWLDAKGRQRVEGPEMRRGRKDMFGTLQQGNRPVRDMLEATASGDRWIEEAWSKGKAVNAPQLRGHRDFADLLQQTYSNPYKSSSAEDKVGDVWLTSRGKAAVPGFTGGGSQQEMQCTLQGVPAVQPIRLVKTAHTASHLEQKLSLHPCGQDRQSPPRNPAFAASHLEARNTLHPM
ncbi:hypothetical protein ABBQ32_001288 [Trebouxia sp. C0010 RCD-2024]